MRKKHPRMRSGKFSTDKCIPPYVALEEEKQVLFLIESGVAYLAIPTFMKQFPDDYKGLRVRNKETFREYGGKI